MAKIKRLNEEKVEKGWIEVPLLDTKSKEIMEAVRRISRGNEWNNGYQKLYLIHRNEKESDYPEDMVIITRYLRESSFDGNWILIDNCW